MKVLLLNPPYSRGYIHSARWDTITISGSHWYPIYLAYCTGLLEKHDHETKLIDAEADELFFEEVLRKAKVFSPDLTVVYISTKGLGVHIKLSEKIKEFTGSRILFVGPWCSINPKDVLGRSEKIDFLARGEFDFTTLELANGVPEEKIRGLTRRVDDKIVNNEDRRPVSSKQLDEFPFVTDVYSSHLNIRNYRIGPQLYPFVDTFTGRGCPWGRCTFCLWPYTLNKDARYRTRSIDNVIAELRFISEKLRFVKEVFIQDDALPPWRARELSLAIIENGLKITWSCYSRADMDYETLILMKRAGCRLLQVGYESSNLQILKNVRKGVTPKLMEKFTRDANKVGLKILADFIIGLPGENEETIKATIKWAKNLNVDVYQFATPKAYPSTSFYEWLRKNGYLKNGEVNYPHLSYEDLCIWVKRAMRECYFNWVFFKRVIDKNSEIDEIKRLAYHARHVIPYSLWKKII